MGFYLAKRIYPAKRINISVVEQPHPRKSHDHAAFVAGLDHEVVAYRAAGLGDISDSAFVRSLDIVRKREESVGAQSNAVDSIEVRSLLFIGEGLGSLGEVLLPNAVGGNVLFVSVDVAVDDVIAVGTADIAPERQAEYLFRPAQEPCVGLRAREARTVDAALLACADSDRLAAVGVADGVALGILQGYQRDDKVARRVVAELTLSRHDVSQQRAVDPEIVPPLLEGHAEHLLALDRLGDVFGVDLDYIIIALALGLQYLERLFGIIGGDHTVADLALQQRGGQLVAGIRERDPVAEGAHTVGAAGACVGAGEGRAVEAFDIVDEAGFFQLIRKRQSPRRRGRADVLERGRARQAGRLFELLHQLPRVERVEKVYISRAAGEDLYRQIGAVAHEYPRGLLVRITAVFEFEFFHIITF